MTETTSIGMTLEEFADLINVETQQLRLHLKADQRKGQWIMNRLFDERRDLYKAITGMVEVDPFYNDKVLDNFWLKLMDIW